LNPSPTITVRRATALEADTAFSLIEEYYEAIGVIVRDDRAALEHYLSSPESSIWLAYAPATGGPAPATGGPASATGGPSVGPYPPASATGGPPSATGGPAFANATPAGCVMLRLLQQIPQAAEVKRLYVRRAFRNLGLAHALMQAAEDHARREGHHWLYLDTKDDLHDAIRFYLSTGYTHCPRYNDNPQATIFLRKRL
jgi:GNAT superfamily N-acetyltransferase